MTPFSLRIFVADGDPDGLRIVDKSNWIGKALVFPRALLPQVKARPELARDIKESDAAFALQAIALLMHEVGWTKV